MGHPDPLLISADITRAAAERPELDEAVVRAVCDSRAPGSHLLWRLHMDIDKLTREERGVLRAKAQLDAFDLRNHGTWYRSRDHDRMVLLGRLADAIEALADARLGPAPPDVDEDDMTALARATIPEIERLLRRPGRRPTKTAVATKVEIDRKTLDDWIRRGWLSWPPTGTG